MTLWVQGPESQQFDDDFVVVADTTRGTRLTDLARGYPTGISLILPCSFYRQLVQKSHRVHLLNLVRGQPFYGSLF